MRPGEDAVDRGLAALGHGDWAAARALLDPAAADPGAPAEAVHGLARAVEWSGDYAAAIRLYERAYAAYRAAGDTRRSALVAGRELAFLHAAVSGDLAVANGWLARAGSLVRAAGDCPERGWVALAEALMARDPDVMERHVRVATDVATRCGDADLRFCALAYEGLCLVLRGRVTDGMRRVDESAAAASGGEVTDYVAVGEIYCRMLLCCELTLDVRRAEQWMAAAARTGRDANAPWVPAVCRTHYGAVLTAAGRWAEAERELAHATRLYDASYRALRSDAVVRLADLRVRQGRYEEAARLLADAGTDAYAVRAAARLHLARGEPDVAAAALRRLVDGDGAATAPAAELALLAEAYVAAGRLDDARAACHRLREVVAGTEIAHVRGLADYVGGVVAAAAGEPALDRLEAALTAFDTAALPLEAARTRLAVARVVAGSDRAVAVAEATAALDAARRLPSGPLADEAAGLLRSLGRRATGSPPRRGGAVLSPRETEVLGLVGEGLSNDEIARRLVLSKRTVEHHVGSVLARLGLTTRAQAVAYAARHTPVRPARTGGDGGGGRR